MALKLLAQTLSLSRHFFSRHLTVWFSCQCGDWQYYKVNTAEKYIDIQITPANIMHKLPLMFSYASFCSQSLRVPGTLSLAIC